MKTLYSYKNLDLAASFKDVDGKKGIVTGYFSKFDNIDADGDIIRKGAFAKTITENGPGSVHPRIKHLLNHNTSQPLGALMTLQEDNTGLSYESQIGSHTLGADFIKMVESNLITEHSIGYQVVKRNQLQGYEEYMKNPDLGMWELTELKLWEGSSLTSWGCNSQTPITGLKGQTKEEQAQELINRQKNIEKFCRNSSVSDETIELLLIECKQLTQTIIELSKSDTIISTQTTEPQLSTLPGDLKDVITTFSNLLKRQSGTINKRGALIRA